jgi:hypothetical protein
MKTQGRYPTAAIVAFVALMLAVPFSCLLLKTLMRLRAQESVARSPTRRDVRNSLRDRLIDAGYLTTPPFCDLAVPVDHTRQRGRMNRPCLMIMATW